MAIDDYEWEPELELAPPSPPAESAARPSWLARLRRSIWLEPALKLAGIAALLGVLATIGVMAQTHWEPGRKLPAGSAVDALAGSWLKPSPSGERAAPERRALALASGPAPAPSAPASPGASSAVPPSGSAASPPSSGVTSDGRVILNSASAEELTRLPGVGKRRAEAIVALRTKLKRFKQPSDLLRVKGIGPRGLKRMLPHLVLDAP